MLIPSERARTREFILNFGDWGTGKSDDLAQIADVYRLTSTPGHFHIISTEPERWDRTAEGYDDFDANCTIYDVEDWGSLTEASEKIRPQLTSDDWIAVDSIGNALTWCRDLFFGQRFGRDFREWLTLGGNVSDVGAQFWNRIDNEYRSTWFLPTFVKTPANRYAVALQEQIRTEGSWSEKDKLTLQLFSRLGLKPVGDKNLAAAFHTVLWSSNPSAGDYRVKTIKEGARNRAYLESARVELPTETEKVLMGAGAPIAYGFAKTYLMEVAGWSLS